MLDADHEGLDEVKDRILEFLAVRVLRRERGLGTVGGRGSGAILALVGPPGVGKTSLGESVARALGRPFVRVAVGGVRDEAEIRGHRRTYVGSRPGRIVRALTEAKAMNPVVLIDEIDKLQAVTGGRSRVARCSRCSTPRRTTRSATTTSSSTSTCPTSCSSRPRTCSRRSPARCSTAWRSCTLDGYTEDEKVAIAKHHLLPAPARAQRPAPTTSSTSPTPRSHALVAGWTREAGVRGLERQLGKIAARPRARSPSERQPSRPMRSTSRRSSTRTYCVTRSAACVPRRRRDACTGPRSRDRSRGHGRRRRRADDRGHRDGRRAGVAGHRPARRRDVGVGARSRCRSCGRTARSSGVDASAFEHRRFHLHVPCGRGAEGRSVGRHHDDHRARVPAHGPAR